MVLQHASRRRRYMDPAIAIGVVGADSERHDCQIVYVQGGRGPASASAPFMHAAPFI